MVCLEVSMVKAGLRATAKFSGCGGKPFYQHEPGRMSTGSAVNSINDCRTYEPRKKERELTG